MTLEHYQEYDLTDEEADAYCAGSENQRVRQVIAERCAGKVVLDIGCGNGIDAPRYKDHLYLGLDSSHALVAAARRRNPGYVFNQVDARELSKENFHRYRMPHAGTGVDVAILKAILEHAHSQDDALQIFGEAMRVAPVVYAAWHTPPRADFTLPLHQRMQGHFGRLIYQNTYALWPFIELAKTRGRRMQIWPVDNYELWEVSE